MNIGLIDVDKTRFPNIALGKIAAYHKLQGDTVEWADPMFGQYDRVYASKVLDRAVQGIRRSESVKRAKRYHEPEVCRTYTKGQKARIYLPILEWTDDDVAEFIAERGIKCHPLYYDEQGNFHVERRLGCIGCPLRSDNGKADFVKYPKFLKRLIACSQEWLDAHAHAHAKFGNAYNMIFHNLFANSYAEYQNLVSGGMFPETAIDAKAFMEDYFKIDVTINPDTEKEKEI